MFVYVAIQTHLSTQFPEVEVLNTPNNVDKFLLHYYPKLERRTNDVLYIRAPPMTVINTLTLFGGFRLQSVTSDNFTKKTVFMLEKELEQSDPEEWKQKLK